MSASQQARNRALVQENVALRAEVERAKALCVQIAKERDEARVAWGREHEAHLTEEGFGDPWAAVRGGHKDLLQGDAAVEAVIYEARWGVPIPADLALQRAADEWSAESCADGAEPARACGDKIMDREEFFAAVEAQIEGLLAGAMFRYYESIYYTEAGSHRCVDCGATFWPFFDMGVGMQRRWREHPERYPNVGGVAWPDLPKRCHACYVRWGEVMDTKDVKDKQEER